MTGAWGFPWGQITHDNLNFGNLGSLGNSKETSGSLGRFHKTNPLPGPPHDLHPTITGRTVELWLPGDVVVINVLPVHKVLLATSVEKSGGGVIKVDVAAVVLLAGVCI